MSLSWKYCQHILPLVSRTFAINIGVLRGDLHRSMLLVYLICRIIDTVEDSPSLPVPLKVRFLRRFGELVPGEDWEQDLGEWIEGLREGGIDGAADDMDLLTHGRDVLLCFKELPQEYQRSGERLFKIMSHGMASVIERFPDGRIALEDVADLERYCYYVAGVVGEFLQEAFYLACRVPEYRSEEFRRLCTSYGLGLQMTNIAKDVFKDYRRGQCYFPRSLLAAAGIAEDQFLSGEDKDALPDAYRMLLKKAYSHLNSGYKMVTMVHRRHVRIRLFCLWALWMAFETLKNLEQNIHLLYSSEDIKVGRKQIVKILRSTTLIVLSHRLLERNYLRNYGHLFSGEAVERADHVG